MYNNNVYKINLLGFLEKKHARFGPVLFFGFDFNYDYLHSVQTLKILFSRLK